MPHWSQGCLAVIRNAVYFPTPVSDIGTTLAIIGAYILAGEISASSGNYQTALADHENKIKPYLKAQSFPLERRTLKSTNKMGTML